MNKVYDLPFAEREAKSEPDLALEQIRQAQADRQAKKMKREDELEAVEHRAKVSEARAKEAEEKRKQKSLKRPRKASVSNTERRLLSPSLY